MYIATLLILTYVKSTSCEMLDWMKLKVESGLQGEISITSDMQITRRNYAERKLSYAENKEKLKSLLMKVKEGS